MCAILDANALNEVFGPNRPEAGEKFFQWINSGAGVLVIGGKVLEEFDRTLKARKWRRRAQNFGRVKLENKNEVDVRAAELQNQGSCKSDDQHVIALAQISGARLLYSNDIDLQRDFSNRTLINRPPGKVYTTFEDRRNFGDSHKKLLRRRDLCGTGQ